MKPTLTILQIIVAITLTILILLQVKGVGFGRVWGSWTASFSRRGLESLIFKFTFFIAFLFILLSILQLIF